MFTSVEILAPKQKLMKNLVSNARSLIDFTRFRFNAAFYRKFYMYIAMKNERVKRKNQKHNANVEN